MEVVTINRTVSIYLTDRFIESLIKQKWSNNKNAFSGPLHKKDGKSSADGSSSKGTGNSQQRAVEVYGGGVPVTNGN